MPRARTIKPDFFASEDVSVLPFRARLTWVGMWTHCDDHGRYKDQVRLIKANVWPLDDVSLKDVEEDLTILAKHGRIVRYAVNGTSLLAVQNWHFHQRINRPGKPKFPPPPVPIWTPDPEDDGHCSTCWAALQTRGSLSEPASPVDNSNYGVTAGHAGHEQVSESSVNVHGGLTLERKGGERKGGDARERAKPPPPRCPKHVDDPTDPPCRACRTARETRERWVTDAAAAERAEVRACRLCTTDGQRIVLGSRATPMSPYVRCDHQPLPRQEPA